MAICSLQISRQHGTPQAVLVELSFQHRAASSMRTLARWPHSCAVRLAAPCRLQEPGHGELHLFSACRSLPSSQRQSTADKDCCAAGHRQWVPFRRHAAEDASRQHPSADLRHAGWVGSLRLWMCSKEFTIVHRASAVIIWPAYCCRTLYCTVSHVAAPCRLADSSPTWVGSSLQNTTAFQLTGGQACPASGSLAGHASSGQAPASTGPLASRAASLLPAGAAQAHSFKRVSLSPAAHNLGAALGHSSTAGKPGRPHSPGVRTFATGPDTSSSDSDNEKVPPQGAFLMGAKLGDVYLMPRCSPGCSGHSCLRRLHAAASGDSPAAKRMQPGVVGWAHLLVAMLGIVCLMLVSACLGSSAQGAGTHYSKLGQQALQGTALRVQTLCHGEILERHLPGSACCLPCRASVIMPCASARK